MSCHNHKHHCCECSHDNVKYCKKCNLTYCENCGMEWKFTHQWYYQWYTPYYVYPTPQVLPIPQVEPYKITWTTWGSNASSDAVNASVPQFTSGYIDVQEISN